MAEDRALPKVSVVVPVYRAEAYLEACVASVLEQDYKNLEIILVDDGSPDGCPALCDRYAGEYERIRAVHQENQGPGAARNTGLREARGEFVIFLDSDDLLGGPETIRKLVDAARGERADIAAGNYRRFQGASFGPVNRHHLRGGEYVKTADFHLRGFLTEGHLISDWGKIYRREFLLRHDLWCGTQLHMEDKLRNMMCCVCEPKYTFIDDCVYLYRIAGNSITRQHREKVWELERDWIYVTEAFHRYLEKCPQPERFEDLLAFHVFCGIFTIGRQPLQGGLRGRGESAVLLREYGKNALVRQELLALARGTYLGGIRSPAWKLLLRTGSILFCAGAYRLIVWGIFLLRGLGTERKESRLNGKGR